MPAFTSSGRVFLLVRSRLFSFALAELSDHYSGGGDPGELAGVARE